jgi:CRISPR type III-A-associated RAMP protein Csm4
MNPGLLVKLRPSSPWRIGPSTGDRGHVDLILHSDTLFSAVTHAMSLLGQLDAWLDATARNAQGSSVAFTSLFPFTGDVRYFVPPRTVWPPAPSAKVRWKGARFVPQGVVEAVLQGRALNEDRWSVDGESECLVASGRVAPFRIARRSAAAVDRLTGAQSEPHQSACLEFTAGSGLWCAVSFADATAREQWNEPVRAAFRLLADSGIGGERSRGWGRSEAPEFRDGTLPGLVFSAAGDAKDAEQFWMLSLFAPQAAEAVDWTRGNYQVLERSGRVDSRSNSGAQKKTAALVSEGSVLVSAGQPTGAARDVAPDGHPHPVYQAGFAFAIAIPAVRQRVSQPAAVEDAVTNAPQAEEFMPNPETDFPLPENLPEDPDLMPGEQDPVPVEAPRDEPHGEPENEPHYNDPEPSEPTPGIEEP